MRKFVVGLIVLAMLPVRGLYALGVGEIELYSGLNEPLMAEIPLTGIKPNELRQITVHVADYEAFQQAGIDRQPVLSSLVFEIGTRTNGAPIINISSSEPIREPFLDFIVEINWPSGRLMREYTLLLDPPFVSNETAAPVQTPEAALEEALAAETEQTDMAQGEVGVPEQITQEETAPAGMAVSVATAGVEDTVPTLAVPQEAMAVMETPAAGAEAAAPTQTETVATTTTPEAIAVPSAAAAPEITRMGPTMTKKNDTLWSHAERLRPDKSVSVHQMMIALLKENPEAFYNNNINQLKAGYVLRMPDPEAVAAISHDEAFREAQAQYERWLEARGLKKPVHAKPAPSTPALEDGTAPGTDGAKLQLISAQTPSAPAAGNGAASDLAQLDKIRKELTTAVEALEASKHENEELRARLKSLEEQISSMHRLLNLKDDALANLQDKLSTGQTQTPQDAGPKPAVQPQAKPQAQPQVTAPVQTPQLPAAQVQPPQPQQEPGARPSPPPKPAQAPKPAPVAATPEPEPSWFDDISLSGLIDTIKGDPKLLGAVVLGALILLVVIAKVIKRRTATMDDLMNYTPAKKTGSGGVETTITEVAPPQSFISKLMSKLSFGKNKLKPEDLVIIEPTFEEEKDETGAEVIGPVRVKAQEDFFPDLKKNDDVVAQAEAESGEVDPLVEVDVYMAYRRYQQAEELVKDALAKEPERNELRVKLMEIYYAAKDQTSFEQAANELYQLLGDVNDPLWLTILPMGRELCPGHPLFGGSEEVPAPQPQPQIAVPAPVFEPVSAPPPVQLGGAEPTAALSNELEFDSSASSESLSLADVLGETPSPAAIAEPAPAGAADNALDFNLGDFQTTAAASTPSESAPAVEEPAPAAGGGLDFDLSFLDEAKTEAPAASPSQTPTPAAASATPELIPEFSPADFQLDADFLAGGDVIDTKLDLARAYIDMGDQGSAKDILNEVVKEGTEKQKQEAQQLIQKLA